MRFPDTLFTISPSILYIAHAMYIRFATIENDRHSGVGKGVFQAAIAARDNHNTLPSVSDEIRSLIRWFNDELPAPDDVNARAIFWYKADAADFIEATWRLAAMLYVCDCPIYPIRCARPGKIVYRDHYQIAAIPFRETIAGL